MPVSTGANANINVRVDGNVKEQAQDVFAALGMDMTTAINIFLRQAIRKNGIPFELVTEPQKKLPKSSEEKQSMPPFTKYTCRQKG